MELLIERKALLSALKAFKPESKQLVLLFVQDNDKTLFRISDGFTNVTFADPQLVKDMANMNPAYGQM